MEKSHMRRETVLFGLMTLLYKTDKFIKINSLAP